jgi:hypothetical protein
MEALVGNKDSDVYEPDEYNPCYLDKRENGSKEFPVYASPYSPVVGGRVLKQLVIDGWTMRLQSRAGSGPEVCILGRWGQSLICY